MGRHYSFRFRGAAGLQGIPALLTRLEAPLRGTFVENLALG
jgi:hypothetical protein